MKINRLLLSASFLAMSVAPLQADPFTELFELITDLDNSSGNLVEETNADGDIISITGTLDGETVVFTPTTPISDTTTSVEITADDGETTETVVIATDASGFGDISEGDTVSLVGEIDGLNVDVTTEVPTDDASVITGTLNGSDFEISTGDGGSFEDFDIDSDTIVIVNDGEVIFDGVVDDLSDVELATIASSFDLVATNPLSILATQATSLRRYFSLVSNGSISMGGNGFAFNVANNGLGPIEEGDTSGLPYNYGFWAHVTYNEREMNNTIGTFDTSFTTSAIGGHVVVNENYLIGLAAGLQVADADTRGTTTTSDFEVAMVSPYAAARLFDGRVIAEWSAVYGAIDMTTARATVTGATSGHRFAGQLALGMALPVSERLSFMTRAGVIAGYDRYDAFNESNGAVVDEFEIAVGMVDFGVTGQLQINQNFSVNAGVKGILDFSNDLLDNDFVEEFDNTGVEFSSGVAFNVSDRFSAELIGTYETGTNDSLNGFGVNGTVRIKF